MLSTQAFQGDKKMRKVDNLTKTERKLLKSLNSAYKAGVFKYAVRTKENIATTNGNFVVDFAIPEQKLGVQIDMEDKPTYDEQVASSGWVIVHCSQQDAERHSEAVVRRIGSILANRSVV